MDSYRVWERNRLKSRWKKEHGVELEFRELWENNPTFFTFACENRIPYLFCPSTEEGDFLCPVGCEQYAQFFSLGHFIESELVSRFTLDWKVRLWCQVDHFCTAYRR